MFASLPPQPAAGDAAGTRQLPAPLHTRCPAPRASAEPLCLTQAFLSGFGPRPAALPASQYSKRKSGVAAGEKEPQLARGALSPSFPGPAQPAAPLGPLPRGFSSGHRAVQAALRALPRELWIEHLGTLTFSNQNPSSGRILGAGGRHGDTAVALPLPRGMSPECGRLPSGLHAWPGTAPGTDTLMGSLQIPPPQG